MTLVNIPSQILRDPRRLWDSIAERSKSFPISAYLLLNTLMFAAYGALIGSIGGYQQALTSLGKLPTLYIATVLICLPTLHVLNLMFGAKQHLEQMLSLLMATLTAMAATLLAFAPISLFFLMTQCSYSFFVMLNVAIMAFAGFVDMRFFWRGLLTVDIKMNTEPDTQLPNRRKLLLAWSLIYAFVGSQLSWTMRPFFGTPTQQFSFFRTGKGAKGNFFEAVAHQVESVMAGK